MYEPLLQLEKTGVQIHYCTNERKHYPVHWHSAVELIYILNGNGTIMVEGKNYTVISGEFIVIDSNQIHSFCYKRESMMIVLHFSRSSMKNFVPDLDEYAFCCKKGTLRKEQLEKYLKICDLLKKLPPLYIVQPFGYKINSHAIALEVFSKLLISFGEKREPTLKSKKNDILVRLGEITEYIDLHHGETVTLEDVSSKFYLSREYFSRFFKKNMGVTFTHYLNQVRLMYIYQEICNTQTGIMELIEKHGFTNYKLFNKMFHEVYGCSPRETRKDYYGV